MLNIVCPFCGLRNESEFVAGGPLKNRRADDAGQMSDREWIEYLTVPPNPIGPVKERWWHVRGCGRWLTITRDTLTHQILDSGDSRS